VIYHIVVRDISGEKLFVNLTREKILASFVCPFINREVTLHQGEIYNMVHAIGMRVFGSDQAITAGWPVNTQDFFPESGEENDEGELENSPNVEGLLSDESYQEAVVVALDEEDVNITDEIYRSGLLLLETGKYQHLRKRLAESSSDQYALFIGPHANEAVDQIYNLVIEPSLQANQFYTERADELTNAGPVSEDITTAILKANVIVADMTGERPKTYYEIGLAHALGKPVIILAQTGTTRHFDIPGYQWHYWNSAEDLKPKFEKILLGTLIESGFVS
jgi:hypothetical protein